MNKIALLGGGALVLVAGAAALPYYVGMKTEKSMQADHDMMAQEIIMPGLEITLSDYQRGWLKSEAITSINFTPEARNAQSIHLEIHHHINQLPNFGHGAIATITSDLVLPPELQTEVDRILQGQPLLTSTTYLKFNGAQSYTISSPAFKTTLKDNQTLVEWKGLHGSGEGSGDHKHITADLSIPGFTLSNPEFNLALNEISYQTDTARGSYEMWFGKGSASLKSLTVDTKSPKGNHTIAINDVQINSEQRERGEVSDGTGVIQMGKSTFDDVALDSAVYDFEFRNIDTKTMHDLQNAIRQTSAGGDPSLMGMTVLSAMPALLKAKPEFNIRRMEVKSSLGNFNGKLHLAFVGEWNDSLASNPLALLGMVNADIDLAMTKSLLVTLTKAQLHSSMASMAQMQGEELTDEELDTMAGERAADQLEMMEANGYLVHKDDNYTSKLHFEKGQLTINDKAVKDFLGTPQQR